MVSLNAFFSDSALAPGAAWPVAAAAPVTEAAGPEPAGALRPACSGNATLSQRLSEEPLEGWACYLSLGTRMREREENCRPRSGAEAACGPLKVAKSLCTLAALGWPRLRVTDTDWLCRNVSGVRLGR